MFKTKKKKRLQNKKVSKSLMKKYSYYYEVSI